MTDQPAVVVVSGGMDSVTLAYYVATYISDDSHGISFNYGQRHAKELEFAADLVNQGILRSHRVVDLTNLTDLISNSSLTSEEISVPDGRYDDLSMMITVVPNRNMIMLAIAAGFAVNIKAQAGIWVGVHAGDHFIYPDCRPPFIDAADMAVQNGNEGFAEWIDRAINAPFLNLSKAEIVAVGDELSVPYQLTWSCYKGGAIHCGRCGTCVERKEAFRLSGFPDPTEYEDEAFEVQAYRG